MNPIFIVIKVYVSTDAWPGIWKICVCQHISRSIKRKSTMLVKYYLLNKVWRKSIQYNGSYGELIHLDSSATNSDRNSSPNRYFPEVFSFLFICILLYKESNGICQNFICQFFNISGRIWVSGLRKTYLWPLIRLSAISC